MPDQIRVNEVLAMEQCSTIEISTPNLKMTLGVEDGLKCLHWSRPDEISWVNSLDGQEFAVYYNGKCINGSTKGLQVTKVTHHELSTGATQYTVQMEYAEDNLVICSHTIVYDTTSLIEKWITVENRGMDVIRIERIDSFVMQVPKDTYELMYYKSGWAMEYDSVRTDFRESVVIDCRKGRSSYDHHPWFTLFRMSDGELLTGSIAWSGNWVLRFEKQEDESLRLSGGLHDWEYYKDLVPGASVESPHVMFALGGHGDLNETSIQFTRVGRKYWNPQNELSQSLPVEWNHWWPYEDKTINETVFLDNVKVAAQLDVELCTLDAGWFGPSDDDSFWWNQRGDWDMINAKRFPSGIRFIADDVHAHGMKFGFWCEIEALGKNAKLAELHPEFVSMRDGEWIGGYVCFGNPKVQEWAFTTLDSIITKYNLDWVKLDFNVDPGAGCNRTDHGHGSGDGLYEHVMGYYQVLTRIRDRHPGVVLENCSGGGLRLDLGILKQTHTTFISDADWPEHNLQVFWGASTMFAPDVSLHWSFNEWQGNNKHPRQTFDPQNPNIEEHQLDYYIHTAMLGGFGFSQKLPELPEWMLKRYAYHAKFYQDNVKKFVRQADLYRLTEQPKREGLGDRWAGFQYSLPDGAEHLVFVFRLDGGEESRTIAMRNLAAARTYTIEWITSDGTTQMTGQELMEYGVTFDNLREEESAVLRII